MCCRVFIQSVTFSFSFHRVFQDSFSSIFTGCLMIALHCLAFIYNLGKKFKLCFYFFKSFYAYFIFFHEIDFCDKVAHALCSSSAK